MILNPIFRRIHQFLKLFKRQSLNILPKTDSLCYFQSSMSAKWRTYFITLFSYAVVHAIRTMWSAIKSNLSEPPFNYEVSFLGTMDMVILFVIAIFMSILGPKVEQFGAKKALIISLSALVVFNTLVGVFLNLNFTSKWLYICVFGLGVGISSCAAWPSCLYMVSLYFDKRKGLALSAWNGTSQLGDFISLITFFIIVASRQWQPYSSFFLASFYLLVLLICAIIFIPKQLNEHNHNHKPNDSVKEDQPQVNQELQQQKIDDKVQDNGQAKQIESQNHGQEAISEKQQSQKKSVSDAFGSQHQTVQKTIQQSQTKQIHRHIGFFSVWLLPGVALNVLAYGFIKSVNAIMVSWLIYYLISLDLGSQAALITLLWSTGAFVGGIISGVLNKNLVKLFFVSQLFITAVGFILLEQMHLKIYETKIIIGIVLSALFFGGPLSLMGTAIPIALGNQKQVLQYQNGITAIISIVEGFGQFFSGITLLIIPAVGVERINLMCAIYCLIAAFFLLGEMYRARKQSLLEPVK